MDQTKTTENEKPQRFQYCLSRVTNQQQIWYNTLTIIIIAKLLLQSFVIFSATGTIVK